MTLTNLLIGNSVNILLGSIPPIYMCALFFNKQKRMLKIIIATFIQAVITSFICSYLSFYDITKYGHYSAFSNILMSISSSILLFLLLNYLFPKQKASHLLFILTIQSMIANLLLWITLTFSDVLESIINNRQLFIIFINYFLSIPIVAIQLFLLYFLKKKHFFKQLYVLGEQTIFVVIFYIVLFFGDAIGYFYFHASNNSTIVINGSLFLLLISLILSIKEIHSKQELLEIDKQLAQQNTYTNYLETMQKELRKTQHDYKNIIAAVYAYAEDNNHEGAIEFIEEHLLRVQKNDENHLHHVHMLKKITNVELKKTILDFLSDSTTNLSLIIENDIKHSTENPVAISDFLTYVSQNIAPEKQKLFIHEINDIACFCYSGENRSLENSELPSSLTTNQKVNVSKIVKNQTVYYYLEIYHSPYSPSFSF